MVERALIVSDGPTLAIDSLPSRTRDAGRLAARTRAAWPRWSGPHILAVLGECGWKVGGKGNAAERLGLNRSHPPVPDEEARDQAAGAGDRPAPRPEGPVAGPRPPAPDANGSGPRRRSLVTSGQMGNGIAEARRRSRIVAAAGALAALGLAGVVFLHGRTPPPPAPAVATASPAPLAGSQSCRSCHAVFFQKWSTSFHGLAMQPHTGDFARDRLTPQEKPLAIGGRSYRAVIGTGADHVEETGPAGHEDPPDRPGAGRQERLLLPDPARPRPPAGPARRLRHEPQGVVLDHRQRGPPLRGRRRTRSSTGRTAPTRSTPPASAATSASSRRTTSRRPTRTGRSGRSPASPARPATGRPAST